MKPAIDKMNHGKPWSELLKSHPDKVHLIEEKDWHVVPVNRAEEMAPRPLPHKMLNSDPNIKKLAGSFTENIAQHVIKRAKERYNLDLTKEAIHDLNMAIRKGSAKFVRQAPETGTNVYEVTHNGMPIRVIYHEQLQTIKTVINDSTPKSMFKLIGKTDLSKLGFYKQADDPDAPGSDIIRRSPSLLRRPLIKTTQIRDVLEFDNSYKKTADVNPLKVTNGIVQRVKAFTTRDAGVPVPMRGQLMNMIDISKSQKDVMNIMDGFTNAQKALGLEWGAKVLDVDPRGLQAVAIKKMQLLEKKGSEVEKPFSILAKIMNGEKGSAKPIESTIKKLTVPKELTHA